MKSFFRKNHRLIFYSSWIILGLIQSRYTELLDDEAYYWVFSRYPDWGYFDHPPLIAALVKMGYAVFPNELGVRLFPLLMNVLTLVIIEKLVSPKNSFLFYAIALSVAVLQLTGFVAVPDIPLIFFTALFFLIYKRFLENKSWLNVLLLALCMAFLLYSKYHGVLIIFFVLLSNLKLLMNYKAWIAAVVAFLLFLPHLQWQYEHDWISFRYHLFESNVNPYKISFTADYLAGQLLLAGPIAGFILIPAAFLYRAKNETERALYFTMTGVYVFFLISSFRGRAEANWTAPVFVPLMVLSHQFLNEKARPLAAKLQKWLYRLLPVTLVIVVFARIIMLFDILPAEFIQQRYHAWKGWPQQLKENTSGINMVFDGSYQNASKYWFYSGQMTYSQNWFGKRRNNFSFWPVEDSMLGKPVYFLDEQRYRHYADSIKTPLGWLGYRYDPVFTSLAKVKVIPDEKKLAIKEGEKIILHCSFAMPKLYSDFIRTHSMIQDTTFAGFFNKEGKVLKVIQVFLPVKEMIGENKIPVTIDPAMLKGKYFFLFTIKHANDNPTHNSEKIPLDVE